MAEVLLVVDARCPTKIGTQALVGGWVRTRRDSKGGFSFLELNDGSSQGSLQIVCDSTLPNYIDEIQKLMLAAVSAAEAKSRLRPGKDRLPNCMPAMSRYWVGPTPWNIPSRRSGTRLRN